jgi:hypothetical protein
MGMAYLDMPFTASMCLRMKMKLPKTFLGLLTIKDGVATEGVIDIELKHLFKGKSGWTIKRIDDGTCLLDFPSTELRDELTSSKVLSLLLLTSKQRWIL